MLSSNKSKPAKVKSATKVIVSGPPCWPSGSFPVLSRGLAVGGNFWWSAASAAVELLRTRW